MTLDMMASIFGWMTVINGALLLFAAAAIAFTSPSIQAAHQRFVDLSSQELDRAYFSYLASFKLMWLFLNFVPYIALRFAG